MYKKIMFGLLMLPVLGLATSLTDVQYTALANGGLEVRFKFDSTPPQVNGYAISKPARISLDFTNTDLATKRLINMGANNAHSIVLVKGEGRLRAIINMQYSQKYTSHVEGNEYVLTLSDTGGGAMLSSVPTSTYVQSEQAVSAYGPVSSLNNIEFMRGNAGAGKINLDLSDAKTPINIYKSGALIKVEMSGVDLPEHLNKQFNVKDFGTPVEHFWAEKVGNKTIVNIRPIGEYDYLAYQSGSLYTIDIRPLTREEVIVKETSKEKIFTGEKISLNYQDVPLRQVLQIIADINNTNLVINEAIQEKNISLRLDNVPWDQALDLILKTNGLAKVQEGDILFVTTAKDLSKDKVSELEIKKKVKEFEPLKTEFFQIVYSSAEDIMDLLSTQKTAGSGAGLGNANNGGRAADGLMSSRGSVIADDRTNTLIVTDTEEKLQNIRDLIKRIDIMVQQVLIEARIVFAADDFSDALGVKWGLKDVFHNNKLSLNNLSVDLPVNGATNIALGISDLASGLLDVEISAQANEGKGEIIATPKVLTMDQQEATISSGSKIAYVSGVVDGVPVTDFLNVDLKLTVKPQIAPDGNILLELHVRNDSPSGTAGSVDTNELSTNVLVKDGQTVVLGGVYRVENNTNLSKTPLLGDIPLIGGLFRNRNKVATKRELLIFITPKLVKQTAF